MLFKYQFSLEERKTESLRIMFKYPTKIPVICEKHSSCKTIRKIDKKKYLVASDYTCGQFMYIIRGQLQLPAEHAMFLFVNDTIPSTSQTLGQLYEEHKNVDGFLYVKYASENTFGYGEPTVPPYAPSLQPLK
jgi:GABA(A) receptor-associated protein